ncbi:uncharacterized protein GGS22DRAFT_148674 [Annulohypoxylon maeteangense]|uniref:uncharacterized protein n=1 Tax=Annulohypoxylon maeteangense TaxID=1927788 RepID=UPI0020080289|nr:uncharacterized protein GGS22DRAFT_148674 [Annulohypoxylon maeteangense]KAI0889593.1 hypothetical protein GGS22DRAFT_148674 [Annulohypoxylon maeteangense]
MATGYQGQAPQYTNGFAGEQPPARERTVSRDYSNTDEWDASKTPPSRFQKRKGSIYATPSSRDGHVERNRDAVEEFHKAHSKRWSVSSSGSSRRGSVGNTLKDQHHGSTTEQRKGSQ